MENSTIRPILAYGMLIVLGVFWLGLFWLWDIGYTVLPHDDAFYYTEIAQHIASGYGPTFDRITQTNGFHPLWALLLSVAALFVPDDPALMMRVALTLQVILVGLAGVWLSRKLDWRILPLLVVMLASYHALRAVLGGMEAALQFALLAAAILTMLDEEHWLISGVVIGLLSLARIEAVIFAVAWGLLPIIWSVGNSKPFGQFVKRGVLAGGIFLPYLVWNLVRFGHLIPVSAAIKSGVGRTPSLLHFLLAAAVVFLVIGYRFWAERSEERDLLRGVFPLVVYCAAILVMTWLGQARLEPSLWYMAPHVLLVVMLAYTFLRDRPQFYGAFCAGAVLFAIASWGIIGFNPTRYVNLLAMRETGLWVAENTPEDAVAAGWDVGSIGAHAQRRLINLEGLVNSWEYKTDYLDQGEVERYIDVVNIDYIVQYTSLEAVRYQEGTIQGVVLADWTVHRAVCVKQVTSIVRPSRRERNVVYFVLGREPMQGQPLLQEWLKEEIICEERQ